MSFSAAVSSYRNRRSCSYGKFWAVYGVVFFPVMIIIIISVQDSAPEELEIFVTDATIARFNFSGGGADNRTLTYSLAMSISVKNPNKNGSLAFDRVQVSASYRGKTFALATVDNVTTPFYLDPNNSTRFSSVLRGQVDLFLDRTCSERYDSETVLGFYTIDTKLALQLRNVRFGNSTVERLEPPEINCKNLRIPLHDTNLHGLATSGFMGKKCTDVYVFTTPPKTHHLAGH